MLEPPFILQKAVFFSEKLLVVVLMMSNSLYRENNSVRTRKISEIQTAIDARERQKSNSVRAAGVEPASTAWKAVIIAVILRSQDYFINSILPHYPKK